LIDYNPFVAVKALKSKAVAKDVFSPEQVTKLRKAAQGTDWEGAILAGAKTLFASGTLDEITPRGGTDSYIYDPLDLRRGEQVENIPYNESTTNIDQRLATNINGDGLIYQSNPMPAEVMLAGFPSLVLWRFPEGSSTVTGPNQAATSASPAVVSLKFPPR
jgi:hypothetical protein